MHLSWRKIPTNIASSVCISLRELHRAGSYCSNQSLQPLRTFKEGDKAGVRLVLADGRKVYAEFPILKEAPKP